MPQFGNTTAALSAPYGGGRESGLMGESYDDLETYGNQISFDHPISKIAVRHGGCIDCVGITYNLIDGTTQTVWHGATKGGQPTYEINLRDTEDVIEVTGLHGTSVWPNEKDQVHLLTFKTLDKATGQIRWTETKGNGHLLVNETRKDILVTGKLLGLAGQANNELVRGALFT